MKKTVSTTEARTAVALDHIVGHCFVFMRENHDWHSDTVAVLAQKPCGRFTVARACDVCEQLLAPPARRRKVKTWTATREELW